MIDLSDMNLTLWLPLNIHWLFSSIFNFKGFNAKTNFFETSIMQIFHLTNAIHNLREADEALLASLNSYNRQLQGYEQLTCQYKLDAI